MSPAPFYPVGISSSLYIAQSMYPVMALVRDKCVLHHFLRPGTLALPFCADKSLSTAVILYLSHLHQTGIRIQNSRNAIRTEHDRQDTHMYQMCGILSRVQAVPPDQIFWHFYSKWFTDSTSAPECGLPKGQLGLQFSFSWYGQWAITALGILIFQTVERTVILACYYQVSLFKIIHCHVCCRNSVFNSIDKSIHLYHKID